MSIYKQASQRKLRVETPRGSLTVEQLWDLSVDELDAIAVSFHKQTESLSETTFLASKSTEDKALKLKFDLVLDILNTKVENQERAGKAAETRAHNKKIDELIAAKQESDLSSLSIEELEALRK